MSTTDANGGIHDHKGQFSGHTQSEADNTQVLLGTAEDRARDHVERMIARGSLSPAARDMDPRDALDQWSEANASTLREQEQMLSQAGFSLRMTPDQLVEGDYIDLEPIIREFGDSDIDMTDLMVAECEMATVESVEDDGAGVMVLHTDQGSWGVPPRHKLDMGLGDSRCEKCGEPVGAEMICITCYS